jgi:hypothetical protein
MVAVVVMVTMAALISVVARARAMVFAVAIALLVERPMAVVRV